MTSLTKQFNKLPLIDYHNGVFITAWYDYKLPKQTLIDATPENCYLTFLETPTKKFRLNATYT